MRERPRSWKDAAPRLTLGVALCWAAARAASLPRPALPADKARELWERAVEERGEGFPKKALASTRRLLASYPDNPLYLSFAAELYGKLDDHARQAAALELFMQVAPFPTDACPALGDAYRRLGRLDQALAAHRRCVALDPNKLDLIYYVGRELERQGRLAEAEPFYRKIHAAAQSNGDAALGLARLRLKAGDLAAARALVDGILKYGPDTDAWVLSAQIDEKSGDFKRAEATLLEAVRQRPGYADLYRILGRISLEAGDKEQARQAYSSLHDIEPGDADAARRLRELAGQAR